MPPSSESDRPLRIGVSSCLLGEKVRFDGGHKRDRFLTDTLGRYFEWVPVCPEVEIGLDIPRPTLRLERHDDQIRLIMPKENRDLTARIVSYSKKRLATLEGEGLSGYLLKRASPSCGMERVRIYRPDGHVVDKGRGLFAEALLARFANLPVEEEGRLHDPPLRENWITRVFAFHRLQSLWASPWKIGDLVEFHAAHKFLLMAHSPAALKDLGAMVAAARQVARAELRAGYEARFMAALSRIATKAKNANVLHHLMGFFKRDLDPPSRRELLAHVEEYRHGVVPLVVPLTLVAHYVRILEVAYLQDQIYLNPHPRELALRNHV